MDGDTLGNKVKPKPDIKTESTRKTSIFTGPCPTCGKKLEQVEMKFKKKTIRGKEIEKEVPKCPKCKV